MNKEIIKEYLTKNGISFRDADYSGTKETQETYVVLFDNHVHFKDESYMLLWLDEGFYLHSIGHRINHEVEIVTEAQFFMYLDIFIKMEKLRLKRIELRKIIINRDIVRYNRNGLINEII